MSDSHSDPQQNKRNYEGSRDGGRGGFRGGRGPGNRDSGGFRIRLSENEMRAARSLQEAFNLRSTVAVLGFAIRTLGQMLDEGKLDELVASHRSQQSRGGNHRGDDSQGSRNNRFSQVKHEGREPKPNPFERPAKPEPKERDNQAEEIPIENSEIVHDKEKEASSEGEQDLTNSNENLPEEEKSSNPSSES